MKIKFITISLAVIVICLVTSCTTQQKKIEVYSFSGENDYIEINNGVIIITDELEKFIGGDLSFKGEELSSVKYSVTKFYFYKDGTETDIQNNVVFPIRVSVVSKIVCIFFPPKEPRRFRRTASLYYMTMYVIS